VPRALFGDRIVDCKVTFTKNINYSIALRKSGFVDLYWNMQLQDSSKIKVRSIDLSFDEMYFIMEDTGRPKTVSISWENEVRMEVAEEVDYPNFDIEKVICQNIKHYVDMFEATILIRTQLWVSHNRFVSIYNIQTNSWETHIKFDKHINLFRKREGDEQYTAGIFQFEDGKLYTEVKREVDSGKNIDGIYSFEGREPNFQVEGEIIQTTID
jgi:hypothetical protein